MPAQMTVDDFAQGFQKALEDPRPVYNRYRVFANKLRQDPRYQKGISAKDLAIEANKGMGLDYTFTDQETWKPRGATPPPVSNAPVSDAQVKADADKIKGDVGSFMTRPLADVAGASQALHGIEQSARGWGQWDASKKEHSLGELGAATGQVTTGVLSGLAEAGISLTSPTNLAMMVAGFGLDKLQKGKRLIPIIKALATGGLTMEMMGDLAREIPEARDALQKGDAVGFGNAVGRGLADVMLGVKAGKETFKGGKEAVAGGRTPKPKVEAPKVEAPPAPRADAPADMRALPKEQLEGAYRSAHDRVQQLQPRMERADAGLKDARAKLKRYQDDLEAKQFKSTPDKKGVQAIEKTIKDQEAHLEELESRHRELAREHKEWTEALNAARDRAVHERAPWYYPPEARGQAPAPMQRRLAAGQEPRQLGAGTAVTREAQPQPTEQAPYQRPGQPQGRVEGGAQPPALPPGTQPFEMMGEQPPMARGQRVEPGGEQRALPPPPPQPVGTPYGPGTPGARPRGAGEPVPMAAPLAIPAVGPPPARMPGATAEPAFHGTERGTKAEPPAAAKPSDKATPAKKLTAGQSYTVTSSKYGHGLKEGDKIVYRGVGTNSGSHMFDVIDGKTGKKSVLRLPGELPSKELLKGLSEGRRPGDQSKGQAPPTDDQGNVITKEGKVDLAELKNVPGEIAHQVGQARDAMGQAVGDWQHSVEQLGPQPGVVSTFMKNAEDVGHGIAEKVEGVLPEHMPSVSLPENLTGVMRNKVGELLGSDKGADYSTAYSRLTHRPVIVAHSQEQMDQLASGDRGSTFLKPGDQGVGGGPLAQVVREHLDEGPVSVVGPQSGPGTVLHESIHQVLGDTKVSGDKLMAALPSDVREKMRAALTDKFPKYKWADEIAAHLGASNRKGAEDQSKQLGLTPKEAKQAWQVYLSLLEKQDPKKAAKLKKYIGAGTAPPKARPDSD